MDAARYRIQTVIRTVTEGEVFFTLSFRPLGAHEGTGFLEARVPEAQYKLLAGRPDDWTFAEIEALTVPR